MNLSIQKVTETDWKNREYYEMIILWEKILYYLMHFTLNVGPFPVIHYNDF